MNKDSSLVTIVHESPNYTHSDIRPYGFTVHSVECPLADKYVADLSGVNYFGNTSSGVSVHYLVGPQNVAQMVPERYRSWGSGSNNNGIAVQAEQTGRAAMSRDEWLTADGKAQIENLGKLIADWGKRHLGRCPKRLSDAELKAYHANPIADNGGWYTHAQVSRVLGGTTHTDPGENYPYDVLQAAIEAVYDGQPLKGGGPSVTTPSAPVKPAPPKTGGSPTNKWLPADTDYWKKSWRKPPFSLRPADGSVWYGVNDGTSHSHSGYFNEGDNINVKLIQAYLKALGYLDDSIDGKFGPNTQAAVKKFQSKYDGPSGKLSVDGKCGPKTWQAAGLRVDH